MQRKLPDSVTHALQVLAQNELLDGCTLEVHESSPGLFEIYAMAKVCVSCATRISAPSGTTTIVNPEQHSAETPTIMPHVCGGCGSLIVQHAPTLTNNRESN